MGKSGFRLTIPIYESLNDWKRWASQKAISCLASNRRMSGHTPNTPWPDESAPCRKCDSPTGIAARRSSPHTIGRSESLHASDRTLSMFRVCGDFVHKPNCLEIVIILVTMRTMLCGQILDQHTLSRACPVAHLQCRVYYRSCKFRLVCFAVSYS